MGILSRTYKLIKNQLNSNALILMYHSVAELQQDPWCLRVSPDNFAEQLQVIRHHGRPVSLRELVQSLVDRNPLRSEIVLTFDDGYADNLYHVKPLLEKYEIPATFFITTGYIDKNREFWWDELERILLQPRTLPDGLRINIDGRKYERELGASAIYGESDFNHHRSWKIWHDYPTVRHEVYFRLWELIKPLSEEKRQIAINELISWAKVESEARATHRPLSKEELFQLGQGGLTEIGAHTVTHPTLASIPENLQQEEIRRSKAYLEDILNRPATSFAYPYGGKTDYTQKTIALVQDAGFERACSLCEGVIVEGMDKYELPRMQVGDWNGDEFSQRHSDWLEN